MDIQMQEQIDNILKAFKSFNLGENLGIDDKDKDGDYWANSWYEFQAKEGIETFIGYLFLSGLMYRELWLKYKELGNISFHDLNKSYGDIFCWRDSYMYLQEMAIIRKKENLWMNFSL